MIAVLASVFVACSAFNTRYQGVYNSNGSYVLVQFDDSKAAPLFTIVDHLEDSPNNTAAVWANNVLYFSAYFLAKNSSIIYNHPSNSNRTALLRGSVADPAVAIPGNVRCLVPTTHLSVLAVTSFGEIYAISSGSSIVAHVDVPDGSDDKLLCSFDSANQMLSIYSASTLFKVWLQSSPPSISNSSFACLNPLAVFPRGNTLYIVRMMHLGPYWMAGVATTTDPAIPCSDLIGIGPGEGEFVAAAFDGFGSIGVMAADAFYNVDLGILDILHMPVADPYIPSRITNIFYN